MIVQHVNKQHHTSRMIAKASTRSGCRSGCFGSTHAAPVFASHVAKPLESAKLAQLSSCPDHGSSEMEFWCDTCSKGVCQVRPGHEQPCLTSYAAAHIQPHLWHHQRMSGQCFPKSNYMQCRPLASPGVPAEGLPQRAQVHARPRGPQRGLL